MGAEATKNIIINNATAYIDNEKKAKFYFLLSLHALTKLKNKSQVFVRSIFILFPEPE
jgi:hypothetical protein